MLCEQRNALSILLSYGNYRCLTVYWCHTSFLNYDLNHSYANVDYSYSNVSMSTYSTIVHVFVSSKLSNVIA